jgi:hypothetical protein
VSTAPPLAKTNKRQASTLSLVPQGSGEPGIGDSAAIAITASYNVDYGPPERTWDEDVRDVLQAVSRGQVLLGEDDAGQVVMVDIPGGRLGVSIGHRDRLRTRHPATWA